MRRARRAVRRLVRSAIGTSRNAGLRMEEAGFSQALDAIYDAATQFERWPAALDRLGDAFGASYVALIDRNVRTMQARASAIGLDPGSQREFFDTWSERDVLRLKTR